MKIRLLKKDIRSHTLHRLRTDALLVTGRETSAKKYLMMVVLLWIFSVITIVNSDLDLIGVWVLQEDTSITLVFDETTVSRFHAQEFLHTESYSVDLTTGTEPELIMFTEMDTTSFVILGITDSTLTLMDGMQGNLLFYRREK